MKMDKLSHIVIYKQINDLTSLLIKEELCIDQNFPSNNIKNANRVLDIYNSNITNVYLKNLSYETIYDTINLERAFNLKLIDGALLRFQYIFNLDDDLMKGRLSFFPSPTLFALDQDSELYKADRIYGDIISEDIYPFPIRFDFDIEGFVELTHPASHMTLGQYKNCRMPVTAPLTPFQFTDFILRNFYFTFYNVRLADNSSYINMKKYKFNETITELEREISYLNIYKYTPS